MAWIIFSLWCGCVVAYWRDPSFKWICALWLLVGMFFFLHDLGFA